MSTANERLRDASTRHQIEIRRYVQGRIKEQIAQIAKDDQKFASLLRKHLNSARTEKRIITMFEQTQASRKLVWKEFRKEFRKELGEFAKHELLSEIAILESVLPFQADLARVAFGQAKSAITNNPFQGRLLREWFQGLETAERIRMKATITQGIVEGQTTNQIVQQVIGTKANSFTDGILSVSRREATSVIRTATNSAANTMREKVWQNNADIISALVWSATLDGRTSPVCRARDGHFTPVDGGPPLKPVHQPVLEPSGARPPAHINCRSFMIPYFDDVGLVGTRTGVASKKTNIELRKEWTASAKKKAGDSWKTMDNKGRNSAIRSERSAWGKKHIGKVPASMNYNDWLRTQPAKFQDEVLGKTKGQLYRRGKVNLDKFVDRNGNELTIDQLRVKMPSAFKKAKL